jgi:hypothetical protein
MSDLYSAITLTSRRAIPVLAALCLAMSACGGGGNALKPPGPPVGHPVLPDIAPAPPTDVHTTHLNGRWLISYSSIMVNVGKGDFILRAKREGGIWHVEQDIQYSTSGGRPVAVPAQLVWGGDGHHHWHIKRVATNRLVRLNSAGRADPRGGLIDSKTGFCFYDFSRQLDNGPPKPVYSRKSCGNSTADNNVGMGLSRGWGDTYNYALPGQSIDITGLADGRYRLWAKVDEARWFHEARTDNNVTWVDIDLSTTAKGARTSRIVKVGPLIRPGS